jgi:hypothetical protein
MEPIYYPEGEYIVTMPSSNIISHQLNLYGAENVLVGGLVRQFGHSYHLTWPKNSILCLNEVKRKEEPTELQLKCFSSL